MSNKEAYARLLDTFNIASESTLKKSKIKPVVPKPKEPANRPKKFKEMTVPCFSTGNKVIDDEMGRFW